MNKFREMSIYDVDTELENADGEKISFTFKPLPFKYYADAYDLFSGLYGSGVLGGEENADNLLKVLNKETVKVILELEKIMVTNSYPDMDVSDVERFVSSNMIELLAPLGEVTFKQSKGNDRRVSNELSKGNREETSS